MTKEEIGQVLRDLRTKSGKTQKEVAEIIGRKQQVIGHWETGYAQPDANMLFELCDIYNTTVDEAFGFSQNKKTAPAMQELSIEENEIINGFRLLNRAERNHILWLLDRMAADHRAAALGQVVLKPEEQQQLANESLSDIQELIDSRTKPKNQNQV